MSLSVGIVGLPNVGKSTLFNALSSKQAEAANYAFCTIEPNVGVVPVPDPRFDALVDLFEPKKVVPASVDFVDIAGLVRGASKGEGKGNAFLSNIRDADAIVHVVRCFEDDNVLHVDGKVNPLADIETIETELMLKDLDTLERRADKARKAARGNNAEEKKILPHLEAMIAALNDGKPTSIVEIDDDDILIALKELGLITRKKMFFVCNVKEEQLAEGTSDALVAPVKALADSRGVDTVVICAAAEAEIMQLDEDERADFLEAIGLEEPGLHGVIRAGYASLNLITFFTCGPTEVHAWTIREGTKGPQAAGKIHSDFERGFIRAEVIATTDMLELKTEAAVKSAGKMGVEGKEYVVRDGDIIHFRFNV